MAYHVDVLDRRDPIAGPFAGAVLLHAALIGAAVLYTYLAGQRRGDLLGETNPGGGAAYTVSPVKQIPISQQSAPPNPVASDTESMVRSLPAKQVLEQRLPDREAVAIPDKTQPKRRDETTRRLQHFQQPVPDNQVLSRSRPAVSNPMYGMTGSGQVGIGPSSPLGTRFGWYAELIRQRIAQNWATNGLDVRAQGSPAMISFNIDRNGGVSDIKVFQSSGNPSIDNSALRAVYQSNPLPPLPPQITDSFISAQFTFNLR